MRLSLDATHPSPLPPLQVGIFITYLTPDLAKRMHETEGGYDLLRLKGIQLHEGLSLAQME